MSVVGYSIIMCDPGIPEFMTILTRRIYGFDIPEGAGSEFLPGRERRGVIKGIAASVGIICARPRIFALRQDRASIEKSSVSLPIEGWQIKVGTCPTDPTDDKSRRNGRKVSRTRRLPRGR